MSRAMVWKHDCVRDGQGENEPCDPPCDEPWQVDLDWPKRGAVFATFPEALAYADQEMRKP
jgi:hypothetical protein